MIKATFLTQLQQNIAMLDDDEQKDILDEYTQHIDMKVAGGMTEAEAIEDFGPFDDLVAEILSAYHVKAPASDAALPDAAAKPASALAGLAESAGSAGKAAGRAVENAASKAVAATKNGVRKAANAVSSSVGKANAKMHAGESDQAAEQTFCAETEGNGASETATQAVCEPSVMRRLTTAAKRVLAWCWKTLRTLVRWAWNIFAGCCVAFLLAMGLFSLAATGFCAMLLIQGYPAIGITIALLGATTALLSASYLVTRLIVRKQPAADKPDAPDSTGTFGNRAAAIAPESASAPTVPTTSTPIATPSGSNLGDTRPLPPVRQFSAAEPPYRVFEGLVAPYSREMGAIHE